MRFLIICLLSLALLAVALPKGGHSGGSHSSHSSPRKTTPRKATPPRKAAPPPSLKKGGTPRRAPFRGITGGSRSRSRYPLPSSSYPKSYYHYPGRTSTRHYYYFWPYIRNNRRHSAHHAGEKPLVGSIYYKNTNATKDTNALYDKCGKFFSALPHPISVKSCPDGGVTAAYNKPAEMVLCTLTCESTDKNNYDLIAEGLGSGTDLKTSTPKALKATSNLLPDPMNYIDIYFDFDFKEQPKYTSHRQQTKNPHVANALLFSISGKKKAPLTSSSLRDAANKCTQGFTAAGLDLNSNQCDKGMMDSLANSWSAEMSLSCNTANLQCYCTIDACAASSGSGFEPSYHAATFDGKKIVPYGKSQVTNAQLQSHIGLTFLKPKAA